MCDQQYQSTLERTPCLHLIQPNSNTKSILLHCLTEVDIILIYLRSTWGILSAQTHTLVPKSRREETSPHSKTNCSIKCPLEPDGPVDTQLIFVANTHIKTVGFLSYFLSFARASAHWGLCASYVREPLETETAQTHKQDFHSSTDAAALIHIFYKAIARSASLFSLNYILVIN